VERLAILSNSGHPSTNSRLVFADLGMLAAGRGDAYVYLRIRRQKRDGRGEILVKFWML
jgi:hypothetical protein